jgi:hypothetical protein
MSTEEQAREAVAQQRLQEEKRRESMVERAESEAHNPARADAQTDGQARELTTKQRQHEENIKENMLNRAESEME